MALGLSFDRDGASRGTSAWACHSDTDGCLLLFFLLFFADWIFKPCFGHISDDTQHSNFGGELFLELILDLAFIGEFNTRTGLSARHDLLVFK